MKQSTVKEESKDTTRLFLIFQILYCLGIVIVMAIDTNMRIKTATGVKIEMRRIHKPHDF